MNIKIIPTCINSYNNREGNKLIDCIFIFLLGSCVFALSK